MSLQQEFELLRRVPLFAEIEPAKLKLLAFMSERVGFDAGQGAVPPGRPGRRRLSDHRGRGRACWSTRRPGPMVLATLGANEIVGEMAILCDVPRTATVQRQGPHRGAAHRQGPVHAHGARISEDGGVDHARAGAPAGNRPTTSCATRCPRSGGCARASRAATAGVARRRNEPPRQLHPPARGAARLPRQRRRADRAISTAPSSNSVSATAAPTTICANTLPGREIYRLRAPRRGASRLHAAAR